MTKRECYDLYLNECAKYILAQNANERILRKLEDQLDISEPGIDDFRRTLFNKHYAIRRLPNLVVPQEISMSLLNIKERISDALDKVILMP